LAVGSHLTPSLHTTHSPDHKASRHFVLSIMFPILNFLHSEYLIRQNAAVLKAAEA
jgi:hypothetical protein